MQKKKKNTGVAKSFLIWVLLFLTVAALSNVFYQRRGI